MLNKGIYFIVTLFLLFFGTSVLAEPVDPSQRMVIILEDGAKVEVMPMGDEYGYCWMSVSDGQCYVKKHDGVYILKPMTGRAYKVSVR